MRQRVLGVLLQVSSIGNEGCFVLSKGGLSYAQVQKRSGSSATGQLLQNPYGLGALPSFQKIVGELEFRGRIGAECSRLASQFHRPIRGARIGEQRSKLEVGGGLRIGRDLRG